LDELTFEAAASRAPSPYITDIVQRGIREADAVIALFTPDEQSALYDPATGAYSDNTEDSRWQARPNVIFEAGLAYGVDSRKTIVATLGTDVRLFSDLEGVHYVDLARADAKAALKNRLESIVGALDVGDVWQDVSVSGDFISCLRSRWRHYDELNELAQDLAHVRVLERSPLTLAQILRAVANSPMHSTVDWSRVESRELILMIREHFGAYSELGAKNLDELVDNSYWWLLVHGVLCFDDIDEWFEDDEYWEDSVRFTYVSKRGARLLAKFRLQAAPHIISPLLRSSVKRASPGKKVSRKSKKKQTKKR
jgi:hypothetical protein